MGSIGAKFGESAHDLAMLYAIRGKLDLEDAFFEACQQNLALIGPAYVFRLP